MADHGDGSTGNAPARMARATKAISLPRTRARSKASDRSTQRAVRHDNGRRLPMPVTSPSGWRSWVRHTAPRPRAAVGHAADAVAPTIIRAAAVPAAACVAGMRGTLLVHLAHEPEHASMKASDGSWRRQRVRAWLDRYFRPREQIDPSPPVADEVVPTTCYMCACRCGIRVHLLDGRIRYIDGNSRHPVNRGVICGKGAAGIMQHHSPARLRAPLLRVGERGEGKFKEIGWEEALDLAVSWLAPVRASDPKKLAFFTGRDQSQSLTSLWATSFGTPNWAAHGGFCSVNMAAAGQYTVGGSFWEFGEPDWEHAALLPAVRRRRGPRQQPDQAAASAGSRRAAPRSSPSTRSAPATPPSPTSGWASAPARTACSSWR